MNSLGEERGPELLRMFRNSVRIGRIFGIEISIDLSWLLIVFLVGWSFYAQFDIEFADLAGGAKLLLASLSAVLFFGSVLLHELSHSVVARLLGISVKGITLFLFGGVTTTQMEARRPRDEFLVAAVGPATSLGLAGVSWLIVNLAGPLLTEPVSYAVGLLGWLNFAIGLFNLLPGFPLDGGRVLRSILWRATGSLDQATRRASQAGRAIAMLLAAFGIIRVFGGDLSGLWLAAIGWFLFQAAMAADQDVVLRSMLQDVTAAELMSPDLMTIPSDATIQEAVDGFFLRYDYSAFPVADEEKPGLVTLRAIRRIPRDQWHIRQVWTAATGIDEACTVFPSTPMHQVLERLREHEDHRVLVVEGRRILGIITPRDIARWVRRSQELGLEPSGQSR